MFPHNYKNQAELNAYINEYKSLLDQQIANIEENYNQNMLYFKTGQQISEPPDTRSLDQKMMDTQKILNELRPKLLTITDGVYASQILNQLKDNLNLLRFVYNSWPRIESYMQTNFARGVTALIFMNYINEQVKVTTKEVGQLPYHIFRPKILEYSQQFLNDIINKGNLIKSKSIKTTFNAVLGDLKERIRLYKELQDEENKLTEDNPYMIEGMTEWMSEFEENQKGLIKKWEGLIEGAMMYHLDNETELENVINMYRDMMIVEDDLTVNDIRRLIKLMRDTFEKQKANKEKELNIFDPSSQTNPDDYYSKFPQEPTEKQQSYYEYFTGKKPSSGKGLAVHKKPQRRVKVENITPKPALYNSFGKYIINKPDLNKRILKLRGAKGGALVKFPTQAISSDLAEVLKQITNGDIPSNSILDSLDNEDKIILHNIIKDSQMNVKVPDVNYDKTEREYRRFLLLKGEVLSGNNNPDMIRELKRLIIKLSSVGRLPKAQANLSLQELTLLEV